VSTLLSIGLSRAPPCREPDPDFDARRQRVAAAGVAVVLLQSRCSGAAFNLCARALDSSSTQKEPPMRRITRSPRRWLGVFALFIAVSGIPIPVRAQSAPPQPDPTGAATGDRTSVTDAAGTAFVGTDPASKDLAAKEPLAMKLADGIGHIKIATNTAWTLNTGYLVLFMQAGFALLTCGLVRKTSGAFDDAELCRVRVRVSRLLRRRLRLSVRRGGDQRRTNTPRPRTLAQPVPPWQRPTRRRS